jgi:hypothetical protein
MQKLSLHHWTQNLKELLLYAGEVTLSMPWVRVGGLDFIVLVIGPKFHGFKPSLGRWAFGGDKICSTTSFGREVKPSVPCRKILRHVKQFYGYERGTSQAKFTVISRQVSPCFGTRYVLPEGSGVWIRNYYNSDGECTVYRKWEQCMGRLVPYRPVAIAVTVATSHVAHLLTQQQMAIQLEKESVCSVPFHKICDHCSTEFSGRSH